MKLNRIRDLDITVELFGLMISFTPFRYARPSFRTQHRVLGGGRSAQLFIGPLHVWHFNGRDTLCIALQVGLNGRHHGTYTPTGENVFAFLWRRYIKGPTK